MKPNPFRALPESVEIDGHTFPIDFDFRLGVAIETEILSEEKPDVLRLLQTFYKGVIPRNVGEAVDKMVDFFRIEEEADFKHAETRKGGRVYDYTMDADVILASFLTAYGIDLSTASLHWWTFRRLMLNLPPDTPFTQRVRYRTADLKKLSKDDRKHYKKMQALYAIKKHPNERFTSVEERDAALKEKVKRLHEEARKRQETKGEIPPSVKG